MAKVSESRCVGCETCTSTCDYYNDPDEYYVCDGCGECDETLYVDGKKHYCARCLVENNLDDFVRTYFDELLEQYAEDYAQGYDVVNQE